ncbi:MAG: hypothetical protein Q7R69_02885 [bacterium]|nr:hypothetical protein [bacterium]
MVISEDKIRRAIEEKEISIQPFNGSLLKDVSYTFTLSNKFCLPKVTTEFIDARDSIEFEEKVMPDEGYLLRPGEFIVCYTKEKVTLNNKFVCLISTRASLAQMGLNVTQGSFLTGSDTDNIFALETSNNGNLPIKLFPGMKIAKGVFLRVDSDSSSNIG